MDKKILVAGASLAIVMNASPLFAEQGVDRAVEGTVDTVTSPGQIIEGIATDAEAHGPVGVVTGAVTGTVKAAGQAVTGAAKVGVGVVEAGTDPLVN